MKIETSSESTFSPTLLIRDYGGPNPKLSDFKFDFLKTFRRELSDERSEGPERRFRIKNYSLYLKIKLQTEKYR